MYPFRSRFATESAQESGIFKVSHENHFQHGRAPITLQTLNGQVCTPRRRGVAPFQTFLKTILKEFLLTPSAPRIAQWRFPFRADHKCLFLATACNLSFLRTSSGTSGSPVFIVPLPHPWQVLSAVTVKGSASIISNRLYHGLQDGFITAIP